MSIQWLSPWVLWGLALVGVPIAIHLLVREQSRRVDFPSLRFLRQSQLAAFRRRRIQDALLLACRVGIIALGVLALSGPVLFSPWRSAAYARRIARAIVLEPGTEAAGPLEGAAFVTKTFSRPDIADALADAARWLDGQPPAARELVVLGRFGRGTLTSGHLRAIPTSTGVRFVKAEGAQAPRQSTTLVLREGGLQAQELYLSDESTRVWDSSLQPMTGALRIAAAPGDQALADAAVRAALVGGIRWSDAATRVLVVWDGADERAVQRLTDSATIVRMPRPVPAATAATAVVNAVEQVTARLPRALEPTAIPMEQLQAWSRPSRFTPEAPLSDEGDRRWLWLMAIALLALEYWLRRSRGQAIGDIVESVAEDRVA